MKTSTKPIVVYCRVSTQHQSKEGYSLENQIAEGSKWAKAQKGHSFRVITDVKSGAKVTRKGFVEIADLISSGSIHALWVYDISHLTREVPKTMAMLYDMEEHGIKLFDRGHELGNWAGPLKVEEFGRMIDDGEEIRMFPQT